MNPRSAARIGGAAAVAVALAVAVWIGAQRVDAAQSNVAMLGTAIGFAAGDIPKIPLNLVLLKSCDVRGVLWGGWTERDLAGHRRNTEQLLAWEAEGKLSTHVHAVYPLAEAPAALKAIAARQVMGKVILRV